MFKKILLILPLLITPTIILAHHGTTGQFDRSKDLQVSGVITDIGFINPHSYIYFDVTQEDGSVVSWHCEMRAATVLRRSGWSKEMFAIGARVDIVGNPSHVEANGCYVETIALNDGPVMQRYAQLEENKVAINTNRALRTPAGHPYIGGDWAAAQHLPEPGNIVPTFGGGSPSQPIMTAAGVAAALAHENAPGDNVTGRLDCTPEDALEDWINNDHINKITQAEDKITLQYGFMDIVRVIHMDMSEHPDNLTPSWTGHSIGKWVDDVLVVDTIGFTISTGKRNIHSEQFHTVERFTLDSEIWALNRTYESDDPLFWENQITEEDTVFLSDLAYVPYSCDDRSVE